MKTRIQNFFFFFVECLYDNNKKSKILVERQRINKDTCYAQQYNGPIVLNNGNMLEVAVQRIKYLKKYKVFYNIYDCHRQLLKRTDADVGFIANDQQRIVDLITKSGFGFWYTHSAIPKTNDFLEFLISFKTGEVLYRKGTVKDDNNILWSSFNEFEIEASEISCFSPIITEKNDIIISFKIGADMMYYRTGKLVYNTIQFNDFFLKKELPIKSNSKLILLKDNYLLCYCDNEYCFGKVNSNGKIDWSHNNKKIDDDMVREFIYVSDIDILSGLSYDKSFKSYSVDYILKMLVPVQNKIEIDSRFQYPKMLYLNAEKLLVYEIDKPSLWEQGSYNYQIIDIY